MKKIKLGVSILCMLSFTYLSAQNCKPDNSKVDKISKQQKDIWYQTVYETGFGNSMINTSDVEITAMIGRFGNRNAINVQIRKCEASTQNASFESQYHAVNGNEFYFGFKDGDPLRFVATGVSNETKMDNILGKLVTTVELSCTIKNKELVAMKNILTLKPIDAIRIFLTNDVKVEKSVKEKNGERMMNKFICFYKFLDEKRIDITGVSNNTNTTIDINNLLVKKDSITGKFQYAEVFEVKNTNKEEIYKRIKLNILSKRLNYISADFPPEKIVLSHPFDVGTPKYGKSTQTFDIKDNKFRYTISDIEYSEDVTNWEKPEETGDYSIIKFLSEHIPEWNKVFKEKVIDYKSDW